MFDSGRWYYRGMCWALVTLMVLFSEATLKGAWAASGVVPPGTGGTGSGSGSSSSGSGCGSCPLGFDHWGDPINGCCGSCCTSNPHLPGDGTGGTPVFKQGGNPRTLNDYINLVNGNLIVSETDLSIPGLGHGLRVTRSKANIGVGADGPFGKGWASNLYTVRLEEAQSGDIRITDAEGNQRVYFLAPQGGYTSAARLNSRLVKNGDGTWEEIFINSGRNRFGIDGLLRWVEDRAGNRTTFSYANGKIITITDASGRTLTITWSGPLITKITDPIGREYNYQYTNELLTKYTNPGGYSVLYEYGPYSRLTKVINPLGYSTEYAYDNQGRVTSRRNQAGEYKYIIYTDSTTTTIIDERGSSWTHKYNSYSIHTAVTDPLGNMVQMVYGANRHLIAEVNPLSHAVKRDYDDTGNILRFTNAVGDSETIEYDANSNVTRTVDALGQATGYEYNGDNRLLRVTDPLNNQTEYTYYANGLRKTITDANGHVWQYEYDNYGNTTKVTDPVGHSMTMAYDIVGNLTLVINSLGKTIIRQYDNLNRMTKVIFPDESTVEYTYNALHLTTVKDQNGRETSYSYDAMGRLASLTDARGYQTAFSYDANGNLLTITDGNSHVTQYAYDAANRLVAVAYPAVAMGTPVERFVYDAVGRVVARGTPNGDTISYNYDVTGRLTGIDYPTGPDVSFSYDRNGQMTQMVDGIGTTSYEHNAVRRLAGVTDADNRALAYEYNGAGNLTKLTDMDGKETIYGYNDRNQVTSIVYDGSQATTYEYDDTGRRTKMTLPNGTYTEYRYDDLGRLLFLGNYKSTGDTISSFAYTLDSVGNRTRIVEADDTYSEFQYDESYQLVRETKYTATGDTIFGTAYQYDPVGNRLCDTDLLTNVTRLFTYDSNNRMLMAGSDTFAYDLAGNLTEMVDDSGVWRYEWSYDNMLTQVTAPDSAATVYAYYGDGKRYSRVTATATTKYILNPANFNVVAEYDGSGNQLVKYGQTLEIDKLVSQLRSGAYSYYHYDGLGSVVELTDASQAVQNQYRYTGFGLMTTKNEYISNQFTFTGREAIDNKTIYFRFRYSFPNYGRFISADPIPRIASANSNEMNYYAFCLNNPIQYIDPSGLYTTSSFSDCMDQCKADIAFKGTFDLYIMARGLVGGLGTLVGYVGGGIAGGGTAIFTSVTYGSGGWLFRMPVGVMNATLSAVVAAYVGGSTVSWIFTTGLDNLVCALQCPCTYGGWTENGGCPDEYDDGDVCYMWTYTG